MSIQQYPLVYYPIGGILPFTELKSIGPKPIKPELINFNSNIYNWWIRRKRTLSIIEQNNDKLSQYRENLEVYNSKNLFNKNLLRARVDRENFFEVFNRLFSERPELYIKKTGLKVSKGTVEGFFLKVLLTYFDFISTEIGVHTQSQISKYFEENLVQNSLDYWEVGSPDFEPDYLNEISANRQNYLKKLDDKAFYYPDFLINNYQEFRIIIEIDEPYSMSGQPIHYIEDGKHINLRRDKILTNSGFTVIRFAEEQIVRTPLSCVAEIIQTLGQFTKFSSVKPPTNIKPIRKIKCWTKNESISMLENKYRSNYLK